MKHMVPFQHKSNNPSWGMFDMITPPDSDDVVTVVSTAWSATDNEGDTMVVKMKEKTHFEQKRNMVRTIHKTEKKAIKFHDKQVKEAGECPKYTL